MPSLKVLLLTGRTLRQGQAKEYGKLSERYLKSVAICEIDPDDMKRMGIKDNSNLRISTDYGSVVVRSTKSLRAPHVGKIFVPYGPWANMILDPKTHGTGMPSLKGIHAIIEPAAREEMVMTLPELLHKHFKKK